MIHVVVRIRIKPAYAAEWWKLITAHQRGSLAEPGCKRFEVLADFWHADSYQINEIWADQKALDTHRQTAHYADWRRLIPDIQMGDRTHDEYMEIEEARQRIDVFTNGVFDVLHAGHVRLLQEAKKQGDFLVVGINSDDSVRAIKGPQRPINSLEDRRAMLLALQCVDAVEVFDGTTPLHLIKRLRPRVLVKGSQYTREQVVGGDLVESYGGRVVLVPMHGNLSSTRLIELCSMSRTEANLSCESSAKLSSS